MVKPNWKIDGLRLLIALGALLLIVSCFLGWLDQPITGWLKGYQIKISDKLPRSISYGMICLATGVLSLAGLSRRLSWVNFLTGAIGIFLSVNIILMFSITDSKRIVPINDLNHQEQNIGVFIKYLPPNAGVRPTFDKSLEVDTIRERLYTTLHFTALGWYAAVLGSLLLLIAFVRSDVGKGIKTMLFGISLLCFLLYCIFILYPYISAEYHRDKGDAYLANGMFLKAIDEYDITSRFDPNVLFLKRFHINGGNAYYSAGKNDMADYYFYRSNLYMLEGNFPQAIFCLSRRVIAESAVSEAIRKRNVSNVYVEYGLSEHKKGYIPSAVRMWKESLRLNPHQFQSYYFLSRAYYEMSSNDEAITAGLQFLKFSKNKIMNANVSANIADAYYKQKNFAVAREYYLNSLTLDPYQNMGAILSLVGK